jgi:uncharacterized delta-60 repeat protein
MKKTLLFIAFLFFGLGFGQNLNPADRDPSFNTFSLPLGNYLVENEVSKCSIAIDGKILIIEKRKLIRLNGNLLDSSFNSDNTGFNDYVSDFVEQPDGKIIVVGKFTTYNGVLASKIIRLNIDGSRDTSFNSGNTGFSFTTTVYGEVYKIALQSDGKILLTASQAGYNTYNGVIYKSFTRLNNNGTLDTSFVLDNSVAVDSFCIQNDGKILFTGGYNLKRINNNGSLDSSFNIGTTNDIVRTIVCQPDSKIIIGGSFTNYNNVTVNRLLRLNSDGTVDNSLNIGSGINFDPINGFNVYINKITIQNDGKILILGSGFSGFNGVSRNNMARINTDGSLDLNFNIGTGFSGGLYYASLLPDNKILVVGYFSYYNNQFVSNIVKLNSDGSRDLNFDNICVGFNGLNSGSGFQYDGQIKTANLQADGKLLVAGEFKAYNGVAKTKLVRLNDNGSLDDNFNYGNLLNFDPVNGGSGCVQTIATQPNGKILLGGNIVYYSPTNPHRGIVRLNNDGTKDLSFLTGTGANAGFNKTVNKIVLLTDGKIIVGGNFSNYNNSACPSIVRLNANGSLDNTFLSGHIGNSYGQPYIKDIKIQNDGKILLLGTFNQYLNSSTPNLIRLNANGSRDTTFNVSLNLQITTYGSIFLLQNGKIILSSAFTNPNASSGSIRLNIDGSLDSGFACDYDVTGIQADDKMFINAVNNGLPNPLIGQYRKINSDGIPDYTFETTPNSYAKIEVLPNGRLLAYNFAETINNVIVPNIYRGVSTRSLIRLIGQDFNFINGQNKFDNENDGCDANDFSFSNLKFNITNGLNSYDFISNISGSYTIANGDGNYSVTPIIENPNYFNVSPASISVNFPAQTSPVIQNFCITPNGVHPDLEVTLLPLNVARPGFQSKYKLIYKNKGNQLQSGTINFNFNDAVLNFVSASTTVSSQTLNNLNWSFTNLNPFETKEIVITLNVNSPTATPPVNSGFVLNYTTAISSTQTDEIPSDNTFVYNQTVVNSLDPNDKTCLEGATIATTKVGDYVHYMIRFENTGTYNAQNITVKDVIDTTKFDINSIVPTSGSGLFITRVLEGNRIEFYFENINLPFATGTNKGFVAFKIKTKATLVAGDTFSNSAGIYFDYNSAITTNTTLTTVANPLKNEDFAFENYFALYPNPVSDLLNIDAKNDIAVSSINIFNTLGQLVLVIPNARETQSVDVSTLKSGNYFIKIISDKGTSTTKFIKM